MASCPTKGMNAVAKQDGDYLVCKCRSCDHDMRTACVAAKCRCCDLEDMFSLLSKRSFE